MTTTYQLVGEPTLSGLAIEKPRHADHFALRATLDLPPSGGSAAAQIEIRMPLQSLPATTGDEWLQWIRSEIGRRLQGT